MPAKRAHTARTAAASPSAARREDGDVSEVASYDVASLPMDDAAATTTPQPDSLSPSQKRAKRETPRGSSLGAGGGAAATPQPTLGEATEASLAETSLQALIDGAAPSTVADTVLSVYRSGDKEQSLCAVLNVLSKAAGVAEVELDANALVDGVEIRPLLEELYNRVPEDSEAYLLVNKDGKYRRFRRAFPEWCAALLHDGFAADVLLDTTFLPVLSQWVMAMSESKARAFRHTATVAVLAFVHALSGIAADLQSQLSMLRAKKDITAVQRRRDDVVEWRDHLFSQAVHQRLRDVAPDIRLASFQSLRRWILEFPDEFMTNKYLRYLGMPLHDKRPELRAEALETILQALAHVSDAYSRMHLFLQYFTARLVELSGDVDVRCTELAIRVVAMMVRGDSEAPEGSELLTNERIDHVLLTLFDERPTVRAAAGVLLKVFIHCRTAGEESEAEQVSVATELLCSFAATLRSQYREAMPEKYLIDALWTPERPPVLLTEYQPILAAAQSDKPLDAVVGLQLVAALLLRLQGRLTLGPLPKDDRRGAATAKKVPQKAQEEALVVQHRLSEDAVVALCTVLELHRGSEDVLQSCAMVCAALDMSTFTSQRHQAALSALLVELRKATLMSPCAAADTRDCLTKAWHQLAFTDYPLRAEAQAHLQELLKSVLAQFSKVAKKMSGGAVNEGEEEALVASWGRMNLVTALVPAQEHWSQVYGAVTTGLAAPLAMRSPTVAMLMVGTAVHVLLWQVKECSEEGTSAEEKEAEMAQRMKDVVSAVLQYQVAMEERGQASTNMGTTAAAGSDSTQALVAVAEVFVYLCDVLALPFHAMAQVQQETLMRLLRGLHEQTSTVLRAAQDFLKLHLQEHRAVQHSAAASNTDVSAAAGLTEIAAARRACSRLEALQLRLVTGVARLFLFNKMDSNALAAPFLVLWTQSPSKVVADTFKSLFHTLRDRAGDNGFALERDTVLAAYNHCVEVGATPVSVEALSQTGMKLASLHFVGTDRFYPCCPAMVHFGAAFATSTDPMLLQAITPYAVKLRPVDALHLLRDQLSKSDIFAEGSNAYVRPFVAALRKAAKLEDSSTSSASAMSAAGKRQRALGGATEQSEEESMLTAIAQGLPEGAAATARRAAGGAKGQRISVAARVVTADGWHVAANGASQASGNDDDEEVIEVPQSQGGGGGEQQGGRQHASAASARSHRSVVNVPTAEDVAASSLADGLDSGEVFVATEEYE